VRKLKKFKRYDEGGAVGAGSGDPFSYTDFSNRARNLRKPSEAAEIDDSRERYASTSASGMMNPSLRPGQGRRRDDGDGEPAKAPPPSGRREIPPTPLTKEEERADSDKGAESSSVTIAGDAKKAEKYRQSLMPVSKPKPKPPAPAAEKTPAASSKPSYVGADDSDDSVDTKKKNELERLKRVGSGAVEQTMMGPVETIALGASKLPAMARAGFGAARKAYDEFTKPAPKEAPRTEPKLDSKPAPKQGELFDAKGNPTAEATRVSPKREPKQGKLFDDEGNVTAEAARSGPKPAPKEAPKAEPKAETKSGAIQPTGKGPSEAGKKLMEKGRGSLKDQAMEAVNKQRVATKDPRGTVRPEPKTIKPTGKGVSKAGKELMDRANNRSSTILEKERKPDLAMQEYISGRETARNRVKDLSDDGLSAERYANKKGGKIPAFKKGGLVGRADGCAQRGKTKGRMV